MFPKLQLDNDAPIKLAQNPEYHRKTRHIRIRHFFARELITSGDIEVKQVSTEYQAEDKLHKPKLLTLCHSMGLC